MPVPDNIDAPETEDRDEREPSRVFFPPSSASAPRKVQVELESGLPDALAPARPIARLNSPFVLRHHPSSFELAKLDGKDIILPEINQLILAAGVGRVGTARGNAQGGAHLTAAFVASDQDGHVRLDPNEPIPANCLPPGVKAGGYLRSFKCQSKTGARGRHWIQVWQVLEEESVAGEDATFRWDLEAYNRWRVWLLATGRLQRPSERILRRFSTAARDRLERAMSQTWPTEQMRKVRVGAAETAAAQVARAIEAARQGAA